MEGESMRAGIRQIPFSLWVIAGALTYAALALIALTFPFILAGGITAGGGLALFLYVFVALFLVAAAFTLRRKRWAYVLGAAVSIILVLLFSTFITASLASPADGEFWLAITVLPLLSLGIVFAILSFLNAKTGLSQKKYLATPMSSGGLLTVAVIGFVVGSLVVGAIGAGIIREGLVAGPADVSIVSDPVTTGRFEPATFTVHLSAGGKVTWINKDSAGHTVTSNTSLFDSGTFSTGRMWSHTFTATGEYPYYCTIHRMMVGKIVVVP